MRVAIASEGWPPYPIDTSIYTHTRDALAALKAVGVDAYPIPLPSNRDAKIGGLVRPFLRRALAGYHPEPGTSIVHHVSVDAYRGADVVTVHDLAEFVAAGEFARLPDRLHRLSTRAAFRRARRVVVTTEWTALEARRRFGRDGEKARVVPVPHPWAEPGMDREPRYDALWIGRNSPLKNLPLYLRLAEAYPGLRFALRSAKSPGREGLDHLTDGMLAGLRNVTRLPRLSEEELDRLYRSSPVLVVTSQYEGFHVPAMEAYLRGAKLVLPTIQPFLEIYGGEGGGRTPNVYWYDPRGGLTALGGAFWEAHLARAETPSWAVTSKVSPRSVGNALKAVYEELVRA